LAGLRTGGSNLCVREQAGVLLPLNSGFYFGPDGVQFLSLSGFVAPSGVHDLYLLQIHLVAVVLQKVQLTAVGLPEVTVAPHTFR